MPDPVQQTPGQLAAKVNSGEWFNDAPPGAALQLDELFPNPETVSQQPTQAPATAPAPETTPAAAPTAPASEYFLEVETGTKYRTREEVIRGIAEKDRYIAALRAEKADLESKYTPKLQPAPQDDNSPEKLFDAIAEAAGKQDKRGYIAAQARLTESILAPYLPLMAEVAREKAIREAEAKAPGIREFMGSEGYRQLTERIPLLKDAISQLDNNPVAAQAQLGQLMDLARLAGAGLRTPETVRAQSQPAPAPAQTQPRPTLSSTTVTPAPGTAAPQYRTTQEALNSAEGRKAIVEAYRQKFAAGADQTLESVGL